MKPYSFSFVAAVLWFALLGQTFALAKRISNPILAQGRVDNYPASQGSSVSNIAVQYDVNSKAVKYLNLDNTAAISSQKTGDTRVKATRSSCSEKITKRAIQGKDDRAIVSDTTKFPSSLVGRLECKDNIDATVTHACTATLIGPRTILTAAHCVHIGDNSTNAFYPSCQFLRYIHTSCGSEVTREIYDAKQMWIFKGHIGSRGPMSGDLLSDMAVVHLKVADTGAGYMAFGYDERLPVGTGVAMLGYPQDLQPKDSEFRHMYSAEGKITAIADREIQFDADGLSGSSGSAIYANSPSLGRAIISGTYVGNWPFNPVLCGWLALEGTPIQGCP